MEIEDAINNETQNLLNPSKDPLKKKSDGPPSSRDYDDKRSKYSDHRGNQGSSGGNSSRRVSHNNHG